MINEERVRHMTKIAICEKEEGRSLAPMMHYSRKDYLALHTILNIITGTVFYLLIYLGIVMLLLMVFLSNLHTILVIIGVIAGILGYITYMYFYLRLMHRRAEERYDSGKKRLKKLASEYRILEEMYQQEEETETPEGWD